MKDWLEELTQWSLQNPEIMVSYIRHWSTWAKPIIEAIDNPETVKRLIELSQEI